MRWFAQHPKLANTQTICERTRAFAKDSQNMVILEFNEKEIDELNEAIRNDVDEHGGTSNISKLKNKGVSESHQSKFIGLSNETAGTLVSKLSKRLKKAGYFEGIFEALKKIYKDKTLHKQLDMCNYAIVLKSYLLELYGKKYSANISRLNFGKKWNR